MRGDEHDPVASRTLAMALRAEAPTTGDAIRIARAVAEEVARLHAAGRAHGAIGPDTVLVDGDAVRLTGSLASTTGLAARPALRNADLEGTGRVLAAVLGWSEGPVPAPIERLLARARAAYAPASALAQALVRLQQDPIAVAALLPTAPTAVDERLPGLVALVGLLVPRSDRRSTGVAAVVLGGVAALGAVLLLAGTPGSTVAPPQAIEAAVVAPAPAGSPAAVTAAPLPTSLASVPRPATHRTPHRTQQREAVAAHLAVRVAGPAAPPSPTPLTVPTAAPSTPAPTAAPSSPAAAPTATAAPPVSTSPTAAPTPPPVTIVPSSAPPAPSASPLPSAAPTPAITAG